MPNGFELIRKNALIFADRQQAIRDLTALVEQREDLRQMEPKLIDIVKKLNPQSD